MFRVALSTLALVALSAAPIATTQAQGTDSAPAEVTVAKSHSWCC